MHVKFLFSILLTFFCLPAFAGETAVLLNDSSIQSYDCDSCSTGDCHKDCYDYRIECTAYLYVKDKKCGFATYFAAEKWCKDIAHFWDFEYDPSYCEIYPEDENEPNGPFCAKYERKLKTIVGNGKADVFKKYYMTLKDKVYDGYFNVSVCMKFDKYCKAY